ncbi:MAG: signal peptidase II [Chloroflexi bacterium]|nr:signal peptidase II [Chloroflexota bacterium]
MRKWLRLLLVIVLVLAADQISKRAVVGQVTLGASIQTVFSPFFQITRSQNTGASFGFLPQAGDLFLVIAIVVVLAMVCFYPRIPQNAWLMQVATGLVCGGALGNALDRLEYGHVVDFIHYQIPGLISNVSNLADHAIVLGVILLFVDSWRTERAEKRRQAAAPEDAAPPV